MYEKLDNALKIRKIPASNWVFRSKESGSVGIDGSFTVRSEAIVAVETASAPKGRTSRMAINPERRLPEVPLAMPGQIIKKARKRLSKKQAEEKLVKPKETRVMERVEKELYRETLVMNESKVIRGHTFKLELVHPHLRVKMDRKYLPLKNNVVENGNRKLQFLAEGANGATMVVYSVELVPYVPPPSPPGKIS